MLIQAFGYLSMHVNMYGGPGAQMASYTPAVKSSKLLQKSPDTTKHLYVHYTTSAGVIVCVWMLEDGTSAL